MGQLISYSTVISKSGWLNDAIDFYINMGPNIKSSLVIVFVLVIVLWIAGVKIKKRNPLEKPHGFLLLCEILVNFINDFTKDNIGPKWKKFAPFILTLAIFIFVSNLIGLLGFSSPNANVAITIALGIITGFVIQITGIKEMGIKAYIKSFFEPTPILFPVNLIGELVTPFSLGMRLFGNILSGTVIMSIVYMLLSSSLLGTIIGPFVTVAFHAIFDIFFGIIQTYVFILLTAVFISGKIPDAD